MKGKLTEFHTFIPHSPKMFLSVLIFALFFVSCGQVEDTTVNIKQPEIPAATDSEYCTIRLSLSMEQSAVRGIVPSYDLETLYYKFGYVSGSSGAVFEFPGDGEPGADYATITAKQFQILTGKYMFSLTAYPDSSCTAGTQVLEYVSAEMSLGVDTTSIACPLQPPSLTGTAAKGSVSAEFSFPALADIVEVTAKLFLLSNLVTPKNTQTLTPVESSSGMTVTYDVSDIASGTYILLMTFTDSFGKGTIIPERVTVATNGTSIPDSSTGKINLSEKLEAKYRCHVKASGNDSSGTGSVFSPYQTVGGAVSGINARSMADKNWTIVVNGTVTGTSVISSVKAASLSIEGRTGSDTDILDGNSNGTVLKISTAVPVTLKNIKITNGKYDMGGGVLVNNTDASLTLGAGAVVTGNTNSNANYGGGGVGVNGGLVICDGATIKANTAQTSGGGVFVFKGKFRLVSGSIGGTNADDANTISGSGNAVGGGVVVTANGTFTMTGGTITGNESKVGGGIYVLGTFAMEGGTISENIALNGGGVYNGGSATISGGTITRNGAVNGAGIMNAEGKTLSMTGGTISANSAETGSGTTECNGGGIYNGGTVFLSGTAVIGDSGATTAADASTHSNFAKTNGGGIYNNGGSLYIGYTDATTPDSTFDGGIYGNYAGSSGGGICCDGGSLTIGDGAKVNFNGAAIDAGGINLTASALTMTGGEVCNNSGSTNVGGFYMSGSCPALMTISGGKISGNSGGDSGGIFYDGGQTLSISGSTVISDNYASFEGGGIRISSGVLDLSGGTISGNYSGNGTRAGGAIAAIGGGRLRISGSVYIPSGATIGGTVKTGYGCNDVGQNYGAIVISGKITPPAVCTNGIIATITPRSYEDGFQQISLGTGVTDTTIAAAVSHFAITPKADSTSTWSLTSEGKLKVTVPLDVEVPTTSGTNSTYSGASRLASSSVFIKDRNLGTLKAITASDHETTQGEYEKYCKYGGTAPSDATGKGEYYPAYNVSWYDAVVYCNLRSMDEGLEAVYKVGTSTDPKDWTGIVGNATTGYCAPGSCTWDVTIQGDKNGWRLPFEAEWEFLARGSLTGTQYTYSGSNDPDAVAWYGSSSGGGGNANGKTRPVKQKAANSIGMYDMSGNVWEWTSDFHTNATTSPYVYTTTPSSGAPADATNGNRVTKGGGFKYAVEQSTVHNRNSSPPNSRFGDMGFRVVRGAQYVGNKIPSVEKEVGDIVFNDGSATAYTSGMTVTATQKSAVIAVIFYKGTELNNGDDTTTERTLGAGFVQSSSMGSCSATANAYNVNITTIQCEGTYVITNKYTYPFSGVKNGSNNLALIGSFLTSQGLQDDTGTEENYPAFYFAKNYKSQSNSHVSGTPYENGWYLPSIAELYWIYTAQDTVNPAISACGGTKLLTSATTSSSQFKDTADIMYYFYSGSAWSNGRKSDISRKVCAIREF